MTRGELTEAQTEAIALGVPEAVSIEERALRLIPERIAMVFRPGTKLDKAVVCLQDAADLLSESHYALTEAHAHWLWHTEQDDHDPVIALFFARFYLDDTILRMYSSAEAVDVFARLFLGVRTVEMRRAPKQKSSGDRKLSSRFVRLSRYLKQAAIDGALSEELVATAQDPNWQFITGYRNAWFHEQRLRLDGLGISYARRQRWEVDSREDTAARTWRLEIPSRGDPPGVSIDMMFMKTDEAYRLLRKLIEQSCSLFEDHLAAEEQRRKNLQG